MITSLQAALKVKSLYDFLVVFTDTSFKTLYVVSQQYIFFALQDSQR